MRGSNQYRQTGHAARSSHPRRAAPTPGAGDDAEAVAWAFDPDRETWAAVGAERFSDARPWIVSGATPKDFRRWVEMSEPAEMPTPGESESTLFAVVITRAAWTDQARHFVTVTGDRAAAHQVIFDESNKEWDNEMSHGEPPYRERPEFQPHAAVTMFGSSDTVVSVCAGAVERHPSGQVFVSLFTNKDGDTTASVHSSQGAAESAAVNRWIEDEELDDDEYLHILRTRSFVGFGNDEVVSTADA